MSRQRFFIKEFMMTNQEAIELIKNLKPTNCSEDGWRIVSDTALEILAKKDPTAPIDRFMQQVIKFYNK